MGAAAPALTYAVFVWWFSTGIVLLLVLRARRTLVLSLLGAALCVPISLYVLARTSTDQSVFGAYAAFTAAIVLWGTQELAFLAGFVTGPRPLACPSDAVGWRRSFYAIAAILYHEIALIAAGIASVGVSFGGVNQTGTATFLILWVMRLSAKLNLFLGVPVLNDEVMPDHLVFLRSYFRRGPVNGLFPIAMILSILVLGWLIETAFATGTLPAAQTSALLLSALLGLAILEHGFMLVRLPIDALWRWSTRGRVQSTAVNGNASVDSPRREQPCEIGDIKSVVPTVP